MIENYLFADLDLPFHVWVKEGGRWVLRNAASEAQGPGPGCRVEPGTTSAPLPDSPRP